MKRFIVSCQQHPFFSVTSTHLFPCLPSTPSPIHTLSYTLSPPLAHKFFHTNSLTHLHATGIVFRDLKPENIMLDNTGYLRVIDFGFAKKVPYTSEDPNTGEVKVHAKTYTLCGTPEYLSPELIFNLGHDQSSDLWALGVLIYEMVMASTPFAPKKADNVTELFTNIAMVTKSGLHLSSRLDNKTRDPEVRSIISQLLKAGQSKSPVKLNPPVKSSSQNNPVKPSRSHTNDSPAYQIQ